MKVPGCGSLLSSHGTLPCQSSLIACLGVHEIEEEQDTLLRVAKCTEDIQLTLAGRLSAENSELWKQVLVHCLYLSVPQAPLPELADIFHLNVTVRV